MTRDDNGCYNFGPKDWMIALIGLVFVAATSFGGAFMAFANVQNDVEHLKTQQTKYEDLDDKVDDMQVMMARVIANQENINKLLSRHDKSIDGHDERISRLERVK